MCVCVLLFLLQSKADTDVLGYKQLKALPRVKAVYDIQKADIIPYQADHAHTQLLEGVLERNSCGWVHTLTPGDTEEKYNILILSNTV